MNESNTFTTEDTEGTKKTQRMHFFCDFSVFSVLSVVKRISHQAVMVIAFLMIGTQTLKVARSNPAEILKSE